MSDSTSLDDFSLHIHYYEIMLVSRPIETNNNHSEILSILSYNKVMDESFVSGILPRPCRSRRAIRYQPFANVRMWRAAHLGPPGAKDPRLL